MPNQDQRKKNEHAFTYFNPITNSKRSVTVNATPTLRLI